MGNTSKKHNIVLWTSIVQVVAKINEEIFFWNKKKIITVKANGTLFKINERVYCLTIMQAVNWAEEIKIYVEESFPNIKMAKRLREITCRIDFMSYETGICILECDMVDLEKWKLINHVAELAVFDPEHIPNNFEISVMSVDYTNTKSNILAIKKTMTPFIIKKLEYDNIYFEHFPKLPHYTISSKNKNESYLGSACVDARGNVVGMIHAFSANKYNTVYDIIPAAVILKILANRHELNILKLDIPYETHKKNRFNFRETDEIIEIDNLPLVDNLAKIPLVDNLAKIPLVDNLANVTLGETNIMKNKLVYDNVFKTYITAESYLALNTENSHVCFKIKRQNKILTKNIKLKTYREIYDMEYSHYREPNIIDINDLIFVEATCELLEKLEEDGYSYSPLQNNIKCFLLVLINDTEKTKNIYDYFEHNTIANIKSSCLILVSINNKLIKNKEDMHAQLNACLLNESNDKKSVIVLNNVHHDKILLTFEGGCWKSNNDNP